MAIILFKDQNWDIYNDLGGKTTTTDALSNVIDHVQKMSLNTLIINNRNIVKTTDEDNNKYIDFINSWGPMILGHAHEEVIDAVAKTAVKGTSFGIPTELETKIQSISRRKNKSLYKKIKKD